MMTWIGLKDPVALMPLFLNKLVNILNVCVCVCGGLPAQSP